MRTASQILTAFAFHSLRVCVAVKPYVDMTVADLWDYFDCDDVFGEGPRPLHSPEDWMEMRDAYQATVGLERSSLVVASGHGFTVQIQARQADAKGRGVFAMAPIQKGALVWSTKFTARFEHGRDYRRFLHSIGHELACDVLQWAYVQSVQSERTETTKVFISADLDEGSFINSYYLSDNDEEEDGSPNIGCDPEAARASQGGCNQNYFALRDIAVDEELLLDYHDFAIPEGWQWFGL